MMTAQLQTTTCGESDSHEIFEYRTQSCCWGWRSFGALIGLVGGTVFAILGSVFTASSWITSFGGLAGFTKTLGTVFLSLTIPLLFLGAHLLDVVESGKHLKRRTEPNEDN